MTVYDLNREQLIELKQHYLTQMYEQRGESVSQYELSIADEVVPDQMVYEHFDDVDFVNDDFFCSAGEEVPKLSEQLAEIIAALRDIKGQGWWAFESPSPSSTEAKIKHGVFNAIQFLESARRAAIDSHI